jgi:hypothetical protein
MTRIHDIDEGDKPCICYATNKLHGRCFHNNITTGRAWWYTTSTAKFSTRTTSERPRIISRSEPANTSTIYGKQ